MSDVRSNPNASGGAGAARLLLSSALAGAAVMILELTATRALAPWFGASLYTWTNVIGVVLLALSLGYGVGGRLADRSPDPRRLGLLLLAGAAASLPAPFLAGVLGEWMLPAPEALSPLVATGHVVRGSLAVTALLFAPPIFLLGMVGPYVTRCLIGVGMGGGRAAGRTLAVSTLGSIVGTYLPAHVLIEHLGVRATLLVASALLVVAALPVLGGRARAAAAGLLAVVAGAVPLASGLPVRGVVLAAGDVRELAVLEEIESAYQYVRLSRWERAGEDGGPATELRLSLDEGVMEFHSLEREGSPLTGGVYYDHFALLPELVTADPDRPLDVAILGGGAGTMAAMLRELQGARLRAIVNVEIDPAVAALGPRFGWDPRPPDLTVTADARVALAAAGAPFDLVILDAYARQVAVPPHLGSVEFFRLVRRRLSSRGLFAMNVSTHDLDTPLFAALRRTVGEVFPRLAAVSVEGSWNVLLLAAGVELSELVPRGTDTVLAAARQRFRRGLLPLEGPGDGLLLTDDAAPLEQLARAR